MSRKEKLIARFKTRPRDFTWNELVRLLGYLGYEEETGGRTGGSRRRFTNTDIGHTITAHKPHPVNIVKSYTIRILIEDLKREGRL